MAMQKQITFLELFRKFITYHETTPNKLYRRNPATIQHYNIKYNKVATFLGERNMVNLPAEDFTLKLANDLLDYLSASMSHNHAVRSVQVCSMVSGFGARHELISIDKLASMKYRREPGKPLVYLTETELKKFIETPAWSRASQKAKDMFIFQCLTGLDYSDLTSVSEEHIKEYRGYRFIIKARNKTVNEANIPLSKAAEDIFKKYNYNMYLLSNPKYNIQLKELAKRAEIKKHLTTHCGRKTFGMLKLNSEGFNIASVSKMLGHRSIQTTETYYVKAEIGLIADEMDKLQRSYP